MAIKVDGKEYENEADAPDLGSIMCVGTEGNKRFYQGQTQDALKLPIYDDLGHGSGATLIDPNGAQETIIGKFDAYIKHWVKLEGGIIV